MAAKSSEKNLGNVRSANDNYTADDFYHFTTRFYREESFWDENPDLKIMAPYNTLYIDEGPEKSARIMDAIWILYDPKSSAVQSGRPEEEVRKEVEKYVLKIKNFKWTNYNHIIQSYREHSRSKIEKELDRWYKILQEKNDYLERLPWGTNALEKNELLKGHDKLFDSYFSAEQKAKQERKEKRLRGGIHRSLVEVKSE